jgi:hypothetical protein
VGGAADESSAVSGVFDADDTPEAPSVDPVRPGALIIFFGKSSNFLGAVTPPAGSTPTFVERLDVANSILYIATGEMPTADPTGPKSIVLTEAPTLAGMIVVEAADAGGEFIELEAIVGGGSSARGAMGVVRSLDARVSGRSSAAGVASIIRGLSAHVSGRTSVQGAINVIRGLSGRLSGRSAAQSALSAIRELAGRAAGIGRAIGELFFAGEVQARLRIDDRTFAVTWDDNRIIEGASWDDNRTFSLPEFGMPVEDVHLDPQVIGDDFSVTRTYTSLPPGNVATKAWFTAKKSLRLSDAQALFHLEITASQTADGQITVNNTTAGLAMSFEPSAAQTINAEPDTEYEYGIKVLLSTGKVHTLEKGFIPFTRRATEATS